MNMTVEPTSNWSVSAEHLPALVALVATPAVVVIVVLGCRLLANRGSAAAAGSVRHLDELPFAASVAALACVVGATVHAAMVYRHWPEDRATAWLFMLDAAGFLLAAGWSILARPGWRAAGLTMLTGTSAAYVYYVVERGESLDIVGLATTSVELAAAMFLLQPVVAGARHEPPAYPWVAAATLPVAVLTVLGSTAFAGSGSEMSPSPAAGQRYIEYRMAPMPGMSRGAGAMATGEDQTFTLRTASPAGPITWPVSHSAMAPGTSMSTPGCTASPTAPERRAAVSLVNRTAADVARYRSLAAAKAAGYVPMSPPGRSVVHYLNPGLLRDAAPLDPAVVPVLVYANTSRGAVLTAATYLMAPASAGQPPRPGGCLTQWHRHRGLCLRDVTAAPSPDRVSCPAGTADRVTAPMMHVWLAPVRGGALAMDADDAAQVRAAAQLPRALPANGPA